VAPGSYWIVVHPEGEFSVQIDTKKADVPDQQVGYDFYADGCQSIRIIGVAPRAKP